MVVCPQPTDLGKMARLEIFYLHFCSKYFFLLTFSGQVVSSLYISSYIPIFYAQYKRCVKSEHFYWLPYSLHTFTGWKVSGIYLESNDIVLTTCMKTQLVDNYKLLCVRQLSRSKKIYDRQLLIIEL